MPVFNSFIQSFNQKKIQTKDALVFLSLFIAYVVQYQNLLNIKWIEFLPVIISIPLTYYMFNYKDFLKPFYARLYLILIFTKLQLIAFSISETILCLCLIISYLGLAFKKRKLEFEKKEMVSRDTTYIFVCILTYLIFQII